MKNLICVLMAFIVVSPAFAGKNKYRHTSRAHSRGQLYKEMTGQCYYKETVYKTKIGWKSNAEMSRMSARQVQFIQLANSPFNTRKVYVSKSLCAGQGKMASRMRR